MVREGDKWSSVQEPWLWFVSLKHPFPPIRRASAQWQRPAQWRRCAWSHTRGTESTAELEREDGSWNALQQLLLLTNGNLRRGKVILMQRMAQWGRSSCLFCHLKEEHSIWSRDRVLEVHTRQSGGEQFVSPVTCSSGKCVCIMDVWYEAYRLRRVLIWIEQSCQSLFVSVFLFIYFWCWRLVSSVSLSLRGMTGGVDAIIFVKVHRVAECLQRKKNLFTVCLAGWQESWLARSREHEDKLLIMCPNKPFQLMSAQPQQIYITYSNKSDGPDLALYWATNSPAH